MSRFYIRTLKTHLRKYISAPSFIYVFAANKKNQVFLTRMPAMIVSLNALEQNIDESVHRDGSLLEGTTCHYFHYQNASVKSI